SSPSCTSQSIAAGVSLDRLSRPRHFGSRRAISRDKATLRKDECGRYDLAGKSVAVPFVGVTAATLVVAGGGAWAKIDASEFLTTNPQATGHQESNTRSGWTAGGGIEY